MDASQSRFATRRSMMIEEQKAAETERSRVRRIHHQENMTIEEILLQNERQRDRTTSCRKRKERSRVSYKNRQENLTNEERLLQNARRRDQYRARKQNFGNQNSSSTESLILRRSPRFIGCGSTIESLDQGNAVNHGILKLLV
ncbi:hypothetical protein MKW92_039147 [Papaver armeniacum]|nr:hypothetical protein MKW92_039147 [Papaver armeniacum]